MNKNWSAFIHRYLEININIEIGIQIERDYFVIDYIRDDTDRVQKMVLDKIMNITYKFYALLRSCYIATLQVNTNACSSKIGVPFIYQRTMLASSDLKIYTFNVWCFWIILGNHNRKRKYYQEV